MFSKVDVNLIFSKQQSCLEGKRCTAATRPGPQHLLGSMMASGGLLRVLLAPASITDFNHAKTVTATST